MEIVLKILKHEGFVISHPNFRIQSKDPNEQRTVSDLIQLDECDVIRQMMMMMMRFSTKKKKKKKTDVVAKRRQALIMAKNQKQKTKNQKNKL